MNSGPESRSEERMWPASLAEIPSPSGTILETPFLEFTTSSTPPAAS